MLSFRILSAVAGIPIMLFSFWYGGLPLAAVVLVLVILGILEMNRLWCKMDVHIWLPLAVTAGVLYVIAAGAGNRYFEAAVLFFAVTAAIVYMIVVYPSFTVTDLAATVFTSLYAGWLLTHLIGIRHLSDGFHYVLLVLACTWSTDTFAYFVGINIGKRKLAPVVSPNKSVEGSLGGVAGSIIAAVIAGILGSRMPLIHYVIIGVLIGVVGQVGDLAESALKRMAGVKDSGRIIPGHGGVLDRFDSLYLTAPAVYYYLRLIIMN